MKLSHLTAQSVFLGIAVFNEAASQLEGLNRRFPEAWSNRQNYPYYKHRIFKSISLADEYAKNLAYCLWEYSLENEQLRAELKSMMIRIQAADYRRFSQNKGLVLDEDYYMHFCQKILSSNLPLGVILSFATADYFVNISGIKYDESFRDKMYRQWDIRIKDYLNDEDPKNLWGFSFLEIEDKMKDPAHLRIIQSLNKEYSEYLGCSVQDYLNGLYFDPECTYKTLGQEIAGTTPMTLGMRVVEFSKGGLMKDDALSIFGQATFLYERFRNKKTKIDSHDLISGIMKREIELEDDTLDRVRGLLNTDKYCLPNTLSGDLILFYEQYLPVICSYYLLAKHHELNRDFFFRNKNNTDAISLDSLDKELKRTKKELKEFKQQAKKHQSEILKVRTESQRTFQDRIKRSQEELVLANQQLNRLSQENDELKDEVAALKASLEILSQQVKMQESVDSKTTTPATSTTQVDLNQSKILIMGGHPHVVAKLKEKLPNCKFCECRRLYQDDFFKNIDYAYIFVEWLNHGMTGKLNKIRPNIPKRVIAATNPDRILSEMEAAYLKDLSLKQIEA